MLKIDKEWLKSAEYKAAEDKWFRAAMAFELGDGLHWPPWPISGEYRNARLAFLKRVQPGKGKADH